MPEFTISCDTFYRLSHMCGVDSELPEGDDIFKTIRLDNGCAVASNKRFMAIENIGGPSGIVHLMPTAELVAQCKTEIGFGGKLTVTSSPELGFAIAKSTFGYTTGNIGVFPGACKFDRWRGLVDDVRKPLTASRGVMYWNIDMIQRLAACSPSGHLVFEEHSDVTGKRPTLIRDKLEGDWIGLFAPWIEGEFMPAVNLPGWL